MKRNPSQKKAIAHLQGPMMVLAGPGSGKTSVIVERTENLIKKAKIPASSILVVTFSKAAALEMKERFLSQTGQKHTQVTFGTFHGVFYGILKQAYRLSAENILSEERKYEFLREMVDRYGEDMTEEGEVLEELSREISMVKGNQISLEHYYSTSCPDEVFRSIYQGYAQKCRQNRLLDFDDMLVYCYDLFRKRPDILKGWQDKFQYILVDEFQDINQIQYDIVRMLAEPRRNLFIVGDDDQSIYHFRGAKPEIMLNFTKAYPEAAQVLLDTNYRCSGNILTGACRLIANNKKRFAKKLGTPNPPGSPILLKCYPSPREEIRFVMEDLREYKEKGGNLDQTAVLFRTNMEAESLVGLLMEYDLPFYMKEKLPNLFEHWIAKNMLAYLQMAQGDASRRNFLQIMNRPNRYLSREALEDKEVSFDKLREFYKDKDWMCDRITTLETHLKILKNLTPYAALNFIRQGMKYEEYLREYAGYRKIKPEDLYHVLDRLMESAKGMESLKEWEDYIKDYTEKLKEQAKKQKSRQEGIAVSTLHSVKGLEYDRVYILNINEGNIPYKKAVLEEQLEEERRLFYVGMTRAKKELILCYVLRQFEKDVEESRFLEEAGL